MIPTPQNQTNLPGMFIPKPNCVVAIPKENLELTFAAERFCRILEKHFNLYKEPFEGNSNAVQQVVFESVPSLSGKADSFEIHIEPNRILISGDTGGCLYAVEMLEQILFQEADTSKGWKCFKQKETPQFDWRGLLLDSSRHFIPLPLMYRWIDMLPALRINRLHLHLTDDQGWRMEILAFPKLTNKGAYVEYGEEQLGYYSQRELRDLVHYAAQRNVMIVPEIEVPAHSMAAIRTFPELTCPGNPARIHGKENLYCAGNDAVFTFLEKVLTEVMEIFPSPYIHLGGDEANKELWKKCPLCQAKMREKGLRDEEMLQSYFFNKVANFVRSSGRIAIGWDEILWGNPDKSIISHWWRHNTIGHDYMLKGLKMGHKTILSPNSFTYFNFPVDPNEHFKPYRTTDFKKAYLADWIPESATADERNLIIGAECCIWTDIMKSDKVEDFLFPRVLAFSELAWSYPEKRNLDDITKKVQIAEKYWNFKGIKYGKMFAG